MAIGQLEPLYRYLTRNNRGEPVSKFLADIEDLARNGYVRSLDSGRLDVVGNAKIKAEIDTELSKEMPVTYGYHIGYQAIGKKMFVTISRVSDMISKTSVALCIHEDDHVDVDYFEYDLLEDGMLMTKPLYSSVNTVVIGDDGVTKRGFLRTETTFKRLPNNVLTIKCDFKVSRATPFYLMLKDLATDRPSGVFGDAAKEAFERQA